MTQNDTQESEVYHGECTRCGDELPYAISGIMCPDCINETAGTDECSVCSESGERICGYHASCLWYCPDCGDIRKIGNRPSRPGSGDTATCLNTEAHSWPGLPKMVRLTYTSKVEPRLRDYISGGEASA